MKIDDIKLITPELSGGNIYRVQISDNTDTFVIFCYHMSSNLVNQAKNLYIGIKNGYAKRAKEADLLYNALSKEKYPTIVIGDLNDISGSYTLRKIESAGMFDSWWKGRFGCGCTYHKGGMYFRLDHILYSRDQFDMCDIKIPYSNVSDHYPIVVDLKFK